MHKEDNKQEKQKHSNVFHPCDIQTTGEAIQEPSGTGSGGRDHLSYSLVQLKEI